MIRQRHRLRALAYLLGDEFATLLAFLAAWHLRFVEQVVPLTKSVPYAEPYGALLVLILVLWPIIFYFHGLYQHRRPRSGVDDSLTILIAVLLCSILLSSLGAWYRPLAGPGSADYFTYSRAFLGIFALVNLVFVIAVRLFMRTLLRRLSLSGYSLQRILVVGAGALGREITGKLQTHQELGFQVVGLLDDDPGKAGRQFFDVPVLGTLKDLGEVLIENRIDQVYVALPYEAHKKMMRLLQSVGNECVEVKLVPDVLQYATLKAGLEDLDGMPVINLSQVPLQGWNSLIKRATDLCFASLGLVAVSPILGIIAAAIWLEDRGPVFYRQERMGLDGRPFMMWKFRSMRTRAEVSTGPVWAIRNDPRRTRLGSFLRRWSLDELPQLWNVLRGDMSLVGPRPERPTFVREFRQKLPHYMLRHRVKAGITGWAQVHGWRGNTSIKKRLQYDLYYIGNWSLGLDLKILWMTLRYGIQSPNAY